MTAQPSRRISRLQHYRSLCALRPCSGSISKLGRLRRPFFCAIAHPEVYSKCSALIVKGCYNHTGDSYGVLSLFQLALRHCVSLGIIFN
jgi:hypothetical protein